MSRVLVVEDSATQALEIRLLLEEAGFEVDVAPDGRRPLTGDRGLELPDLVLTDLHMPEMNGLELVEAIRDGHLGVPVILMTQHGTEEIAVQALQRGAASYLPRRTSSATWSRPIDDVLAVTAAQKHQDQVIESLTRTESRFLLDNNAAADHPPDRPRPPEPLADEVLRRDRPDPGRRGPPRGADQRHPPRQPRGQLRAPGQGRRLLLTTWSRSVAASPPYRDRRVHFVAEESRTEAAYVVGDEGPGFDPASLPDPTDPANLHKEYGRGLLLIRTFMDEVHHNDRGNEITMIKRRGPS